MRHQSSVRQSGAVSLFVVIFAALLMTIVTVSFIQLMTKDQEQATASDLSQSAYDSAQAGVEDAKRLLLMYQACQAGTAPASVNCSVINGALALAPGERETSCDTLSRAGLVAQQNGEMLIQSASGDSDLDQAYTCVRINLQPDDYKVPLKLHESAIVPLAGTGEFDRIEISWFTKDDTDAGTTQLRFPDTGAAELPPLGSVWQADTPALLRTQLIQVGSTFDLNSFDDTATGKSNSNTVFLYPTSLPNLPPVDFMLDARRAGGAAPVAASCAPSFAGTVEYACSMKIDLPDPINGTATDRLAFLRISALYNVSTVSVKLFNGSNAVRFDSVQPEVDSTGRANNLFRRVQTRIELRAPMTYPEAAVDIAGNLCKNFFITDTLYSDSGCAP